jgi:phospholipid transport system substrate-binding protein
MKKFLLVILSLMMSMSIFAAEAPDVFVKKIADEIFEILKTDKDLKAGNREKAYKITEEKILPYFDFDRISRACIRESLSSCNKRRAGSLQKRI